MSIFKEMHEYPVTCPMAEDYDGELTAEPVQAPESLVGHAAVTTQAEAASEPRTASFTCVMDSMFDNAEY